MRKLTVKNFSVIKNATLEFGKITVLIGPQASGKSLLCKLAFFLEREALEIAANSIMEGLPLVGFLDSFRSQFAQRFSFQSRPVSEAEFEFTSGAYSVQGSWLEVLGDLGLKISFSSEFARLYVKLLDSRLSRGSEDFSSKQNRWDDILTTLHRQLCEGVLLESYYIPAVRSLFATTDVGFSTFQSPSVDPLIRRFAAEISWGDRWRIGSVTAGDGILEKLHKEMIRLAGGSVTLESGSPIFRASDGRILPLTRLSSGTQELLPLLNVLERLATTQEHRQVLFASREGNEAVPPIGIQKLVYVEEPEANIFPSTQYELIRLFAWLSNRGYWAFNWIITTHSPYILSSFNNLLEAWQVAHKGNDEKRKEVTTLIDERYWINPKDFRAYSIHDGKLEPIMDEETGLIDGSYLDAVSGEIGAQFDELLRIGDAKA